MTDHPAFVPPPDWCMAASSARQFGETAEALFLTSGFVYDNAEQAEATFAGTVEHYQYSRFGNPTVSMLEQRLALIEGAEACRATATGMAAVHAALLSQLKSRRPGRRVARAVRLLPLDRLDAAAALRHRRPSSSTAAIWTQWRAALVAPGQPGAAGNARPTRCWRSSTCRRSAELAHAAGAIVVVDNVFATPLLQQPLELGADVVVYSCTKHIDGQGRVLGGAVLGRKDWVDETLQPFIRNTGPALSPFNAWVLLKGLETLALRVDAACARGGARSPISWPSSPAVRRVWYPTRADHPQHALAMRQMTRRRHGGDVRGRRRQGGAFRLLNAFRLIAISNNLGDSKSLATHPATTTHMRIGAEERARLGITDGVIRLSVGLEDVADLTEDLSQALDALKR